MRMGVATAGTVQVLPCVLLSSETDSALQCVPGWQRIYLFMALQVRVCLR